MKQILQNFSTGETRLAEVPAPMLSEGKVLIKSRRSLISIGTERMLVEFGKANLLDKARQQPDKVKQVLQKATTDGVATTYRAVKSKLDQPIALGYCQAGTVLECGQNVNGFKPGDRVVSIGSHASVVAVPENLVAAIPDGVSFDHASYTVLAAIGLQGIRLVAPTLGESIAVIGLGVIGLLTVQLLKVQGCRVIAIEYDPHKLALARQYGAETVSLEHGEDPVAAATAFSRGHGVDAVIITASTTSDEPVSQAARMCRKRGRVVLVGLVGLTLNRAEFYEKELSFQVSCSYGPGRYDPQYEKQGVDYPIGFVRWTENRNFQAVLDMMAENKLDLDSLLSCRFNFDDAVQAYERLGNDRGAISILLDYDAGEQQADNPDEYNSLLLQQTVKLPSAASADRSTGKAVCGFLGAGNYASRVLIPSFKAAGANLDTIISAGGVSATHHGEKLGFNQAGTDPDTVFKSNAINTVAVVTRHNLHAQFVVQALESGKHCFVEKPLALSLPELEDIERAYAQKQAGAQPAPLLMVGFNRRFAPQIVKIKSLLGSVIQPKTVLMTMNAGAIPPDSWIQQESIGGGRIIGEACHYIDLMRFLVGHPISSMHAVCMGEHDSIPVNSDKAAITLGFSDGSFGTIHYLANGGNAFPKERIEVFANDAVLQLDNFRKLTGFGWPGFKKMNLFQQNKGQAACVDAFVRAVESGAEAPIPYNEIMEVARTSIEVASLLRTARAPA